LARLTSLPPVLTLKGEYVNFKKPLGQLAKEVADKRTNEPPPMSPEAQELAIIVVPKATEG